MISGLRTALPILARPFNLYEWAATAGATRMGVAVTRMAVNNPKTERARPISDEQRWKSFFRSCVMEGIGVPMWVFSNYAGQEMASKLLERMPFLKLPVATAQDFHGVANASHVADVFNASVRSHYTPAGIIAKQIYDREAMRLIPGQMTTDLLTKLAPKGEAALKELPKPIAAVLERTLMNKFHPRLWIAATVTLASGVLFSAFLTGPLLQGLNDGVLQKRVFPWLLKKLGIRPQPPVTNGAFADNSMEPAVSRTYRI